MYIYCIFTEAKVNFILIFFSAMKMCLSHLLVIWVFSANTYLYFDNDTDNDIENYTAIVQLEQSNPVVCINVYNIQCTSIDCTIALDFG
jgi:hypothetical protein